jgi:hypothetical protein
MAASPRRGAVLVGPTRFTTLIPLNDRAPLARNRGERGSVIQWSCGESNPGPTALSQGFSGCSPSSRFSQPRRSDRRVADGLSHRKVPITRCDAV